jgi:hypothetical protein
MKTELSRRSLVRNLLTGALSLPAAILALPGRAATTGPAPLVDPNDPTAKALGFVRDAAKVDVKSSPSYKPGQHCASCVQYQGKTGDTQGGCNLFPGKQVQAAGWCKVWAQKPEVAPVAKPAAKPPAKPPAKPTAK